MSSGISLLEHIPHGEDRLRCLSWASRLQEVALVFAWGRRVGDVHELLESAQHHLHNMSLSRLCIAHIRWRLQVFKYAKHRRHRIRGLLRRRCEHPPSE